MNKHITDDTSLAESECNASPPPIAARPYDSYADLGKPSPFVERMHALMDTAKAVLSLCFLAGLLAVFGYCMERLPK